MVLSKLDVITLFIIFFNKQIDRVFAYFTN